MPLVFVKRNREKLPNEFLRPLMVAMPCIIAEALSTSSDEGRLTEEDIEVWTWDVRADDLDIGSYDIQVVIFANNYPERKARLEVSRKQIERWLQGNCPKGTCGLVWVVLQEPNSFGAFVS